MIKGKNLSNFGSPICKLTNPYCHINRISGSGKKKSSDYACKRLGSGSRGCLPTQISNSKVMIQKCDSSRAWTKWTRESSSIGWSSDRYYFRYC